MTEHTPELGVVVYVTGVEVVTDGPLEKSRILRNDCKPAAQIKQADRGSVEIVDAVPVLLGRNVMGNPRPAGRT